MVLEHRCSLRYAVKQARFNRFEALNSRPTDRLRSELPGFEGRAELPRKRDQGQTALFKSIWPVIKSELALTYDLPCQPGGKRRILKRANGKWLRESDWNAHKSRSL